MASRQLRALGVTRAVVRSQVRARRWRRVHPEVYATFTGPLPDLVCVPHGGRNRPSPARVQVRQSRHLGDKRQAASSPPVTTIEQTVLDLVDDARAERQVIDVVLRVCQARRTTAGRLAAAAGARPRLRWRQLVSELLCDVADGVTTPLERRYATDVERAHGLPRGSRNRVDGHRGRRRFRDVRYRRWRLVVELDGRAAHPEDEREYDDLRDNEVATRDERTLRFGWRSVTTRPCVVAGQVADVLRLAGWPGAPVRCGPGCALDVDPATAEGDAVAS